MLAHYQRDEEAAVEWFVAAEAGARAVGDIRCLAFALNGLGNIANQLRHDYASARAYFEESLALNRTLPDGGRSHSNLGNLASVSYQQGDYPASQSYATAALALSRRLSDGESEAVSLSQLGSCCHARMEFAPAQVYYTQTLTICLKEGFRSRDVEALNCLASLARDVGDLQRARQHFEETLHLCQDLHYDNIERTAMIGMGWTLAAFGERDTARMMLLDALQRSAEAADLVQVADSLEGAALLARETGQPLVGARLLGAAWQIHERHPQAFHPHELLRYERLRQSLLSTLGQHVFGSARAEGEALTVEEAVVEALEWLELE